MKAKGCVYEVLTIKPTAAGFGSPRSIACLFGIQCGEEQILKDCLVVGAAFTIVCHILI